MVWPSVIYEPQVWDWKGERSRSREDRLFRGFNAGVPAFIAGIDTRIDGPTGAILEDAVVAIAALDNSANSHLASVAGALLRSESVGSSKIEHLDTNAQLLAMAAIGSLKSTSAAAQVWANVEAMELALKLGRQGDFTVDTILAIHDALMKDDPVEGVWSGRVRNMQNWIGGSDECPRNAVFIPPVPDRVGRLLDDLAAFCRRTNIPGLVQAAVAHAQFETIHPFTDGNGRTGRAIIHTILRRRNVASNVVVPTSAALLARVDSYFDSLGSYRAGDLGSYLSHFAAATRRAADEAVLLGVHLAAVTAEWDEIVRPRPGSAVAALMASLLRQPVMSASHHGAGDVDAAGLYRAVDRLVSAGVLVEVTDFKRNRLWVAPDVTSALDDFNRRIGKRQDRR